VVETCLFAEGSVPNYKRASSENVVAYQVATRSTLGMWNNAKLNLACFHKAIKNHN